MAIVARVAVDRRLSDRHSINVDTTLRATPPQPRDTAIVEISASGCRFINVGGMAADDTITLGLPGAGIHHARIVRIDDGQCACSFAVPLTDAELSHILAAPDNSPVEFPASDLATAPDAALNRAHREQWDKEANYRKLPIGYRILIIVGSSMFLWAVLIAIGLGLWSLFIGL